MKRVKPRGGHILAGIPKTGAEVTDKLAAEWIANGLVVEIDEDGNPLTTVGEDGPEKVEVLKPRRGRPPKGDKA